MFMDIILAFSPSGICQYAADAAFAFAKRHEANLSITHVCGPAEYAWSDLQYFTATELEKIKEAIEKRFGDKLVSWPKSRIDVLVGFPENELLRAARKNKTDLIVMGPHEKQVTPGSLSRWGRTGGVLEAVGQRARCPIMIVAGPISPEKMTFSNILVAADLSGETDCVLGYAAELGRFYKAHVQVQHVVDVGSQFERLKVSQPQIEQLIDEAEETLKKMLPPIMGAVDYSIQVWEGVPYVEILKAARWRKADLILMAHHSKAVDPEKAALGSTVAQVALRSSCPTISINRHFDFRCSTMVD